MLDRAVLAGGVDGLEDDQDRVGVAGPEQFLRLGQLRDSPSEYGLGLRLELRL